MSKSLYFTVHLLGLALSAVPAYIAVFAAGHGMPIHMMVAFILFCYTFALNLSSALRNYHYVFKK